MTCRATLSYTERDDGHCTAGWCSTYMCAAVGGGVTSETCSEPYLFAVLMDRFTHVCSFRTKVQGEHGFARDIKVET